MTKMYGKYIKYIECLHTNLKIYNIINKIKKYNNKIICEVATFL